MAELNTIISQFQIPGILEGVSEHTVGHIHRTYISSWSHQAHKVRYVHQSVNHSVFQNVDGLVKNIRKITEHIHRKIAAGEGESEETSLTIIKTKSGDDYLKTADNFFWRTYAFVENTNYFNVCEGPDQAFETARAFGRFEKLLLDFPVTELIEPIPYFMDCPRRIAAFQEAVKNNAKGRAAEVEKDIDFVSRRIALTNLIEEGKAKKILPLRVAHGDMKLNNLLFSKTTGKGVCVLDLDTCMPGSFLYDFGDMVRVMSILANEDETDLQKVVMQKDLFKALVEGYMTSIGKFLTQGEIDGLHLAPRLLALTLGTRFLTDYLNGDTYFRIHREKHNLERARCQFQIVKSMEEQEEWMKNVVSKSV